MWRNWVRGKSQEHEEGYGKIQQTEKKVKESLFGRIKDNSIIDDWRIKVDEGTKEKAKAKAQAKKQKGGFKWPWGLRHKIPRIVTEMTPTNADSAAEKGLINNGAGSGNGTSTEGVEPPKVPEVSQSDAQDPPTVEIYP